MHDYSKHHLKYISKLVSFALANLMLVALAGTILRYKIIFPLPLIDQGRLLQAHAHFAFTGWISHILMTLMALCISNGSAIKSHKFKNILTLNLITCYGIFISFAIQGYTFVSIAFSFLSILISFVFGYYIFKGSGKNIAAQWFKAAVLFNILSSLGTFSLAFQMTCGMTGHMRLASVYFYLHFQYNGWFFFSAMGLLISQLPVTDNMVVHLRKIFWLLCTACTGTYLLSILWLRLPAIYTAIAATCALLQVIAWGWFVKSGFTKGLFISFGNKAAKILFLLAGITLTIKLLLQAASAFPHLNQLVYGFRPIIIGYLHLVFLAIITVFIMAYLLQAGLLSHSRLSVNGIALLTGGILLNEAGLMLQGIFALCKMSIPSIPYVLLFASLAMLAGIAIVNVARLKKDRHIMTEVIIEQRDSIQL